MPDSYEEQLRKIAENDQLASGLYSIAATAGTLFKGFKDEGFSRNEAFALVKTWLAESVRLSTSRQQQGGSDVAPP